jgi:hypothetical protein
MLRDVKLIDRFDGFDLWIHTQNPTHIPHIYIYTYTYIIYIYISYRLVNKYTHTFLCTCMYIYTYGDVDMVIGLPFILWLLLLLLCCFGSSCCSSKACRHIPFYVQRFSLQCRVRDVWPLYFHSPSRFVYIFLFGCVAFIPLP